MMAVIDTEADDTHVDALDMHGATLTVDAETNRFELLNASKARPETAASQGMQPIICNSKVRNKSNHAPP